MNQQKQSKDFFLSSATAKKNASYFRTRAREALRPHFWMLIVISVIASVLAGTSESFSVGSVVSFEVSDESVGLLKTALKEIVVLFMDGQFGAILTQYPFVSTILIAVSCVAGGALLYSLFVGSAVALGYQRLYLGVLDGETPEIKGLFSYFKKIYTKAIGARFLMLLIEFVLSIPMMLSAAQLVYSLIAMTFYAMQEDSLQLASAQSSVYLFSAITGVLVVATAALRVVIRLRYAFVSVILAEYPELGVIDAFRNSSALMKGKKWKLFCLQFSFIGWKMLALLVPYGLGTYILMPYTTAADIAFYHEIARRDAAEETEFPSLDPNDYDPNEAVW